MCVIAVWAIILWLEARERILSQTFCDRRYLGRRVLGVEPSARGPYVPLREQRAKACLAWIPPWASAEYKV